MAHVAIRRERLFGLFIIGLGLSTDSPEEYPYVAGGRESTMFDGVNTFVECVNAFQGQGGDAIAFLWRPHSRVDSPDVELDLFSKNGELLEKSVGMLLAAWHCRFHPQGAAEQVKSDPAALLERGREFCQSLLPARSFQREPLIDEEEFIFAVAAARYRNLGEAEEVEV